MARTDEAARGWPLCLLATVVVASAACADAPQAAEERTGATSSAISDGTPSDESQDAVVFIVHATSSSQEVELCSGTMLTPRLALTARHCVAQVDALVTCPPDPASSGGGVSPDYAPADMYVFGGAQRPDVSTLLATAVRGQAIIDDAATTLCNHDLALILFESDVPGAKIAPVRLDGGTQTGEVTTIVGWGLDETQTLPTTRIQRTDETVFSVGPDDSGLGSSELLIGEGTCEGDSGGPALSATGAVIGLLSRGGSADGAVRTGCTSDDIGLYTAPSGFSQLVLSAYAQAGQDPWLEGQPNPMLAKLGVACNCPDGYACTGENRCVANATDGGGSGGGCSFARRPTAAPGLLGFAVALVLLRLLRTLSRRAVACRRVPTRTPICREAVCPTWRNGRLAGSRRSAPRA